MSNGETLAYFLEEHDLRSLFADWPREICAVLCLDESGRCEVVVHHREEQGRMPRRIGRILGLPEDGFAIVPRMAGYPTRRILFSEERQLQEIVAGTSNLVEVAEDYAINYRFARDEGLDPELVTTGARDLDAPAAPKAREAAPQPAPEVTEAAAAPRFGARAATAERDPQPAARDRTAPGAVGAAAAEAPARPSSGTSRPLLGRSGPRFTPMPPPPGTAEPAPRTHREEPRLTARAFGAGHAEQTEAAAPQPTATAGLLTRRDLPAGYAPLGVVRRNDCHFVSARLQRHGERLRLTLEPQAATGKERPLVAEVLGFRDDFARFVLSRPILGGWRPGQAIVLDMLTTQFPEAVVAAMPAQGRAAEVTVTPRGVFVAPGAPLPPRRRRRVLTPLRVAVGGMALVGLISGSLVSAWQQQTGGSARPEAVRMELSQAGAEALTFVLAKAGLGN